MAPYCAERACVVVAALPALSAAMIFLLAAAASAARAHGGGSPYALVRTTAMCGGSALSASSTMWQLCA